MKFGIVIFPGSNCDQDMIDALAHDLNQEVVTLWHKETDLGGLTKDDCIVLPGGFSYGDYLRCGAMAAHSPIMNSIKEHAAAGGKVYGVCNGFQILCETGLLPGALLQNNHQKYNCKNVYLRSESKSASICKDLDSTPLNIPIAHGEGRYFADSDTIAELKANDQILFSYVNAHGEATSEANPNGSIENIAGICNKEKNVFGMMPHPERATNEYLGNTDGLKILKSLINNN